MSTKMKKSPAAAPLAVATSKGKAPRKAPVPVPHAVPPLAVASLPEHREPSGPEEALESLRVTPRRLVRLRRIVDAALSHLDQLNLGSDTPQEYFYRAREVCRSGTACMVQLLLEVRRVESDVDEARVYLGESDEFADGFDIDGAEELLVNNFVGYHPAMTAAP